RPEGELTTQVAEVDVEPRVIDAVGRLVVAAIQQVSDVAHRATGTDVLEIDCRHAGALLPEAEVRRFGIAVHDRPMPNAGQPIGNDGGEIAKDAVLDQGELVEPGAE